MEQFTELTFKFKGPEEERLKHSQTFSIQGSYQVCQDDPLIQKHLQEALQSITWKPAEISYTIKVDVI